MYWVVWWYICSLVGYTMDTMYFGPLPNAIDIAPDLEMPQFSLVSRKHRDCSMNYTSGSDATSPSFSFRITIRTENRNLQRTQPT